MLTTTLWGEVDETLGQRRETELVSVYWSSMIIAGSRVTRFERTYESAWGIIDRFQHVPQPRPLLIQQEMVVQGKLLSQTSAGLTLLQWLTKFINEIRQAIRRIEAQLRSSTNGATVQTSTLIEEHKNHISVMERQEKIIHTNDSAASDQAPLLVHNAIPNTQLQGSDSVTQSLPDNDSDADHQLPGQPPPSSGHASVEEPSSVNTAKTPLHINVHCAEDDNVNLRVVPPTATVLSDSASTSGESFINLIAFPTCPSNVSPTSVNSQILTSPTPPDITPVTSASRTQIHWAHEHRFNAAQSLLSRHSDPTIPSRARLVSQVQRSKKVAQLRTPSQPQPPCGCPNKTAHNVVETLPTSGSALPQAQGIAGSQVDVMMTEIREIRHEILQWMRDIRNAVTLNNNAWEWGGGLGIERMFLNINGDFYYNGYFHGSNVGGRNGINTVMSTTT
ncbi:hypothetical protein ONZ45_g10069 [Pleurotus djamor]|nr:hypothetical protein ONZ45_g10069 [Pleurotus djamor]